VHFFDCIQDWRPFSPPSSRRALLWFFVYFTLFIIVMDLLSPSDILFHLFICFLPLKHYIPQMHRFFFLVNPLLYP
jgi:hypothetical protein